MKSTIPLTKLETVACARSFGSADSIGDLAKEIGEGIYQGKTTVEIEWLLTKGGETERAPTINLMSKAVIAKALVLSGIQVDNFMKALKKVAVAELKKADADVAAKLEEQDERVVAMIDKLAEDVVAGLPKRKLAGQCKVKSVVTVLDKKGTARISEASKGDILAEREAK